MIDSDSARRDQNSATISSRAECPACDFNHKKTSTRGGAVKVHEYQAKDLLSQYGVPVAKGKVAGTPEEARAAAAEIGGATVIKAQIHAGGRGKGGGIKFAASPDEAEAAARQVL